MIFLGEGEDLTLRAPQLHDLDAAQGEAGAAGETRVIASDFLSAWSRSWTCPRKLT